MRRWGLLIAAILAASVASCSGSPDPQLGRPTDNSLTTLEGRLISEMPEPLSNNAVSFVGTPDWGGLLSFSGLGAGKTQSDITSHAWLYDFGGHMWHRLPDVPGGRGRLASTALQVMYNRVFIFGGYTVAEDGAEISTPDVYEFEYGVNIYTKRAPMPVPVDDTIALPYARRYAYLVSGWHDTGNVSNVQVYDAREDKWFAATPYPGAPVFGHAGGIVGNRMIIADGVKVTGVVDGRRQFGMSDEAWMGVIDPADPAIIRWQALEAHPGKPLYRMAATGSDQRGLVVFAGGSENPYNFNGIGYDGVPSAPSSRVFAYKLDTAAWVKFGDKPVATMDHRGLITTGDKYYTIGGMLAGQEVSGGLFEFELTPEN